MSTNSLTAPPLAALITVVSVASASADDRAAELSAYMDACVAAKHFNGSVLVSKDEVKFLSRGYGMANFEHQVANTSNTKFRIGSITKQFTAMLVMVLQEQGRLDVDDSIRKHLAESPETWNDVTIHHLLTHTSGIPSYTSMPEYGRDMMLHQSMDQMIGRFRDEPLEFLAGEKFSYNNSGYFLLGSIIEQASGVSYEEFLRREICDPLGLHDTGYDRFETVLKHRADGYERRYDETVRAAYLDMSQPYSAGAMYSTVEDLNRWDQALRQRKLIPAKNYDQMYAPDKNDYAYGWHVSTVQGRKTIRHGGGINGFRSHILRCPSENLCVVVLCNAPPANPGKVASDLAAIMFGDEYTLPKVRQIVQLDTKIYNKYEGRYQIHPELILTITRDGDHLMAQPTGQSKTRLLPESKTSFFDNVTDSQVSFVQADDGRATAVILNQDGKERRAERIESSQP